MLCIAAVLLIAGCASSSQTIKWADERSSGELQLSGEFRDSTFAMETVKRVAICPLQVRDRIKPRGTLNWYPPVVLPADSVRTAHAAHIADLVADSQSTLVVGVSPASDSFIPDAKLIETARLTGQPDAILIERVIALSDEKATSGTMVPGLFGSVEKPLAQDWQ